ncbi:MAG: YggS family pyridoxal phosphate enzyme [Actinomycetota bacterium]
MNEATVAARLAHLRSTIARSSTRGPVTLCAVTKGFGADAIAIAQRLGCDAIGENYAQELSTKLAETHAAGEASPSGGHRRATHPPVHFIGRLQSNKIRSLVGLVDVWQSVDRESLITELGKLAGGAHIYVQVNATGEADKGGCQPAETTALVQRARSVGLVVDGLMTVGPTDADDERTRAAFRLVRRQADDLGLAGCSMGMSGDLEIALQEGSTLVRIGTALFGERP